MLADAELAFEPLLPDDDAPLEEQVQALALWCHGFLSGLGASAPDLAPRVPGPARKRGAPAADVGSVAAEVSAEISARRLRRDQPRGLERGRRRGSRHQPDFALAEIQEYARVSTQIVFESLAQRRAAAARDVH